MSKHGARYVVFKVLGGLMLGIGCLASLSFAVTFGIQLFSPDAFPEMSIGLTALAGVMCVLLGYLGWRFVVATPDEMRLFTGR